MRIVLLSLIWAFLFFNCTDTNKKDEKFEINGKVTGDFNDYIYLKYDDIIDSSRVVENTFSFKGAISRPSKAILYPAPPSSNIPMTLGVFMLENSNISMAIKLSKRRSNGTMVSFLDIDSIHGSKSQRIKNSFEKKMTQTFYDEKNDSIKKIVLYDNLHDFIKSNPKSFLSGDFLASLGKQYGYLDNSQMTTLFTLLDSTSQTRNNLLDIKTIIEQRKVLDIGKMPLEISLPDQHGQLINSKIFDGDMVLLEFWASWCIPCRQKNSDFLKVYKTYKNKGFNIVGISIDSDAGRWKSAIIEDKIDWVHLIDTSRVTPNNFKFSAIPFNLLLDREGKILVLNIEPSQLDRILEENLLLN